MIFIIFTMWSFLFSSIWPYTDAWAVKPPGELTSVGSDRGDGSSLSGDVQKEINPDTLTLPDYLGTIRDAWTPGKYALASSRDIVPAQNQKIVVHIQDAHCNYDGQLRISEILDYINKEYAIKSVNLEGGVKNYNLSPLTSITESEIRQRVTDYFVKNGRVNGAEYFATNNPGKVNLWGMEDARLYVANLEIYRTSLKYKREVDRFLSNLSYILTNLKIKIYNRELLEFDSKYIQYKAGNMEFKDYLSYILSKAKEKGFDLKNTDSLHLLSKALDEEPNINFKKASSERDAFVEALQKKLSNRILDELIVKTAAFKNGRVSHKDFYDFLIDKARVVNVDAGTYPELKKYVDYVSTYNSVDKMKVMAEIAELEGKLKKTMIENETQRKLDLLSKNLALLKNVFNISLSKDDYKYFVENRDSFNMENYIAFIEKEVPNHKLDAKLEDGIAKIDEYRDDIAKFYEYSLKRDEAFLKNMKYEKAAGRANAGKEIAIMITGGFHTENLAEHFRRNNIAYVSIMPNFRNNEGYKAPYMDLLAGQETQVEKAIDAALSTMQIYDYLSELGVAVDGERGLRRWLLSIEIVTAVERGQDYIIQTPFERIRFYKDKETGEIKYEVTKRDKKDAGTYNAVINDMKDMGPLLYETHQQVIDKKLEEAYRDGKAVRARDEDVEAVAEFFESKDGLNRPDLAEKILELQRNGMIHIIGREIKDFKGHAGARGIHISENANIRDTLAHEAAAYFYDLGHDFNDRVEKSYIAYAANPKSPKYPIGSSPESLKVELADAKFSPLAERTEKARTRLGRDNAAPSEEEMTGVTTPMPGTGRLLLKVRYIYDDAHIDEPINVETLKEVDNKIRRAIVSLRNHELDVIRNIVSADILKGDNADLYLNTLAYMIGIRENIPELVTAKTANAFERFCGMHTESLGSLDKALKALYRNNGNIIDEMIPPGMTMLGFAESLFSQPDLPSILMRLQSLYGKNAVQEYFDARTSAYADSLEFLPKNKNPNIFGNLESPSSPNRHLSPSGISIAADSGLIEAADGPDAVPALFRTTQHSIKNPTLRVVGQTDRAAAIGTRQELRRILEVHNNLIEANFSALEALTTVAASAATKDAGKLDIAALQQMLIAINRMVDSYDSLVKYLRANDLDGITTTEGYGEVKPPLRNSIDFKKENENIKKSWAIKKGRLEKMIASRNPALLQEFPSLISRAPGTTGSPLEEKTPNTEPSISLTAFDLMALHEFIYFLHQRSFFPLEKVVSSPVYLGSMALIDIYREATPGVDRDRIGIKYIDVGDIPAVQGSMITSIPFRAYLAAFDDDQDHTAYSRVFIQDDAIIAHMQLGTHQANISAKIADPDDGGMIRIQYMEWQTTSMNLKRIRLIKEVAEILGMRAALDRTGQFLNIRFDKDTGAATARDIREKLTLIMRVLLYTKNIDFVLDKSNNLNNIIEFVIENRKFTQEESTLKGLGEVLVSIPKLRNDTITAINNRLRELGVQSPPIPADTPRLTQRIIDDYVNHPIEHMVERGELVWKDGRLERNGLYNPAGNILKTLSEGKGEELIQAAEIGSPLFSRTEFDTVGIIGKYTLQVGTVPSPKGTVIITVVRNTQNNNIIFAQAFLRHGNDFMIKNASEFADIIKQATGVSPKIPKVPKQAVENRARSLTARIEPKAGIVAVACKAASPGKGPILSSITMEKKNAGSGRMLLTTYTTPEDFPAISASDGVIAISGGITSHASITCRELDKPSLILPNARFITLKDGTKAVQLTTYEPTKSSIIGGYEVWDVRVKTHTIMEGTPVIVDGKSGQLLFADSNAPDNTLKASYDQINSSSVAITPLHITQEIAASLPVRPEISSQKILNLGSVGIKGKREGDQGLVGAKAANLGELTALVDNVLSAKYADRGITVKVPRGFVVTINSIKDIDIKGRNVTDAINSFIQSKGAISAAKRTPLEELVTGIPSGDGQNVNLYKIMTDIMRSKNITESDKEALVRLLLSLAMNTDKGKALRSILESELASFPTIPKAVRSSSVGEDSREASFAGMGVTDLYVPDVKIFEYVMNNFVSIATERSLAYKAKMIQEGISTPFNIDHAVVVQEMVDAEFSGVIFTSNPLTGNPGEMVINTSYGLGEALVSGRVDPDEYIVDKKSFDATDWSFGQKRIEIRPRADLDGTETLSLPNGIYSAAFGSNWRDTVRTLGEIATDIESYYGMPMDIEFAIKNGAIYILQARPITTLSDTSSDSSFKKVEPKPEPSKTYEDTLAVKSDIAAATELAAGPIYESVLDSVPVITDILNRDANTYLISPAQVADYTKTVEWASKLRRGAMGRNHHNITAKYYKVGDGEDWLKGLAQELYEAMGRDDEHPGFLDNILKQMASKEGAATDRLCIRVMGEAGREAVMKILNENGRIKALGEKEKQFVLSKIRIETVEIGAIEHLNPVPDLLTDILAMEFDRYMQGDYQKEAMPDALAEKLGIMLRLTTTNITPNMVARTELEKTIDRLFKGDLHLEIKPIDWKSIDEWRNRNNQVAIAA